MTDDQNLLQELGYIEYADNRVVRRVFPCQYCNRKYKYQTVLSNHLQTHERKLNCTICKIKFANLSDFHSHSSAHIDKQPYTTSIQNTNNKIVTEKVHYPNATEGTGSKSAYKRDECSSKYNINVKVEPPEDHEDESLAPEVNHIEFEYMCYLCKKEFEEYEPMIIHMRLHTGVKPFDCIQCNRKFMFLKLLREHMQHHYDDPNPNLIIVD